MVIMTAVSLAAFFWPPLTNIIGGAGEINYPWQPWTAVFLHGWPGFPLLLHLAGNLILLALIGPVVENRLGKKWFLAVTIATIGTAGLIRLFTELEYNGASAFIWAYAPLLLFQVRNGNETGQEGVLLVMWLVVPLAMGILISLNGAGLLTALLQGNTYHFSATAVGFTAVWLWQHSENPQS